MKLFTIAIISGIAGAATVFTLSMAKTPATLKQVKSDAREASKLYQANCATCHGDKLQGGMAASLVDGKWEIAKTDAAITDAAMVAIINDGNEELGMPGFGDTLSQAETLSLVSYIKNQNPNTPIASVTESAKAQIAVQKQVWVDGLEQPWGLTFLDENTMLVTEIGGQLRLITNGQLNPEPIKNTPAVWAKGQGGLLDIAVDPGFAQNGWVYMTFSHALDSNPDLAMTKLVRGKIKDGLWTDEQVLFEAKAEHYSKNRRHFGSRIAFDDQGHIYFSIGDRGEKNSAQDLSLPNGKIHRLMHDGSVPADNYFLANTDAYPSIFSYGNRNAQGLVWGDGVLWETEHGPKGGDELNRIKNGANYGWPVISYGRNYSGTELTPFTHRDGMEQPASQWTPSIAVSGLEIYQGEMFAGWQGYLLAGALKFKELRLIEIKDGQYVFEQILLQGDGRVRDVTSGPDGAIYVLLDSPGQILRLTPGGE